MSHPENSPDRVPGQGENAGAEPAAGQGVDPWRPRGTTYGSSSGGTTYGSSAHSGSTYGSAGAGPPPTPAPAGGPPSPAAPAVPGQPEGVHDHPTTLGLLPGGTAPSPPAPPPPRTPVPPGPGPGTGYLLPTQVEAGPAYAPPLSGPPSPGAPLSGAPFSAPPAGLPVPSPPAAGVPARGSKLGLVLVSVAAGLLLLAGGALGYLWYDTTGDLESSRDEVASLEGTVAGQAGQITDLQGQLDEAQEQIDVLETSLAGSEGEVEHLQEANEAIESCLDLIDQWLFTIVVLEDQAEADRLFDEELDPACQEAEQYR